MNLEKMILYKITLTRMIHTHDSISMFQYKHPNQQSPVSFYFFPPPKKFMKDVMKFEPLICRSSPRLVAWLCDDITVWYYFFPPPKKFMKDVMKFEPFFDSLLI